MTMPDSDAELVARSLAGRAEALEALVRRHLRAAYAVALARTGDPQDAEDLAQDAFVAALERLGDLREPERFLGWLLAIVRNRAESLRRSRWVQAAESLEAARVVAVGRDPAEDAERALLRGDLLEALAGLSEVQREVALLHDVEGWRHGEIAERLGMPEGTSRYHLHAARRALRERLAARYAEESGR